MHEVNMDAPAIMRRRRRIARQQREETPEPIAKTGGIKPKYSDEESSSTTTTPYEFENRAAASSIRNSRSKPISTSSGAGSGNGSTSGISNVAYRNKILNRRDRAQGPLPTKVRSQSTPRQLKPEPKGTDEKDHNSSGNSNVMTFLRQAKRSLSIPRRRRDVACETSPIRGNDDLIRRYARMPLLAKVEPNQTSVEKNDNKKKLTKMEMNLKRFEEEQQRFELEKEEFEREKKQIEQVRFQRLIEFERKRSLQRIERERLAMQAAVRALAEIEKVRNRRSKSKSRERELQKRSHSKSLDKYEDDYESSTALSSSSRDDDFDDEEEKEQGEQEDEKYNEIENKKHYDQSLVTATQLMESIELVETIEKIEDPIPPKQSLISRILCGKRKKMCEQPAKEQSRTIKPIRKLVIDDGGPISIRRIVFVESPIVWQQLLAEHPDEWDKTMQLRNRCIADFIALSIFFGLGGLTFRFIEGAFENFYKCGVRRVKRDFVDHLWLSSHNLREEDWKSLARSKLRSFEEELHTAHEAGMTSYSGLKSWTFVNAVVYCMTVVTTIGYGHISPATNTGRAITIVYAIIGIPIFLILLADFGKLFTRGIKFLWAYVRRLYYTGSLRRVRKQAQVQEMIRGMNIAYEIATFRRPSMMMKESDLERVQTATPTSTYLAPPSNSETPTTPIPPEIDIDDEFNLPISLAFFILVTYILCGATVYSLWEEWSFFESCYFIFVSMSTIGFGDYVPKHPMRMMASIIYLIFGLSLTSMCINVVQMKLSNSFRQASAKIGATIGLTLAEEEARSSQNLTPVPENVSIHSNSYSVRPESKNDYIRSLDNKSDNSSFKFNVDSGTYDNAEVRVENIVPANEGDYYRTISSSPQPPQLMPKRAMNVPQPPLPPPTTEKIKHKKKEKRTKK